MDEPKEVDVFYGQRRTARKLTETSDPFAKSNDDLKGLGGIDPTVRRRLSRGLEKAYTGAGGAKTKQVSETGDIRAIDAYNLFGCVLPPYNLDYLAKIYEMSAPHYAAVKVKVANITGLGYDFVDSPAARRKLDQTKSDRTKKNIRSNIDTEKQALEDWLDECNADDEFGETLQKVWTDYETMGNGYIEVGRGLDGTVKYLGHIPAATMRVRARRDGFVQMVAERVVFFRNFGDKETADPVGSDSAPNEVIHLKKYSPTNGYYGIPDIVAAQQAVVGNEFSARFNLDYFENKAVPRYVIVLKGASFSETAQGNLLEFFEGLRGQNHRTLFIPLPPDDSETKIDFEMKPIEAGNQDSSFNNYREANLNEILMAHRVPISKVSTSGTALAAARDADKTFKETVCRPEQAMLEKKLNRIIKEMTDVVKLKLNELTLTDEDTLATMDETYLRMNVMVPDDIRVRRWGWEALPDGDKVLDIMKKPDPAAPAAAGASQAKAEATTQATGNRSRDQQRAQNATDSKGEARNEQGAGRTQS